MASKEINNTLLIKNLPKQVHDLLEPLQQLQLPVQPLNIRSFGRRRALLTYENTENAQQALEILNNAELQGKNLNVSFVRKGEKTEKRQAPSLVTSTKSTQTNILLEDAATAVPKISKYLQKLYACNADLNFEQPPPPYLKYAYPRIDADILDAISIALMSNARFYTQVLHLMNRMNLEPPFGPRTQKLQSFSRPKDASTQTEASVEIPVTAAVAEISESELESSEDEAKALRMSSVQLKRKIPSTTEQYKKKARQVLQTAKKQAAQTIESPTKGSAKEIKALGDIFDKSNEKKTTKIALNLQPKKAKPKIQPTFIPPTDYSAQQLTAAQMQEMPIYKNYQMGEPHSKLYIKNLSKDVAEEDLFTLYSRFTERSKLEIKLMQQGRMKGQAFITFSNLGSNEMLSVAAQALKETNGFILRDKPMIVCYGKK